MIIKEKPDGTVIHSQSVHLFEYNDDKMLFDVASGVVVELSDFAYEFIYLCTKQSWPEVISFLQVKYPSLSVQEIKVTLEQLKAKGLFKVPPEFDEKAQKERIQVLWRHHPRRLQLVISQSCNLKCIYCYMENNDSNSRKCIMSKEQAFQAVNHLIKRSGRRRNLQVTFFGGEPLLNFPVIKDVVRYCKECQQKHNKKFIFELITNGTLLDGEIADFVIKNDMLLMISIDGWKEMHNKQRSSVNGQDYYDKILLNAKRMIDERRKGNLSNPVKIRANLTPDFYNVKEVVSFFQSQGFTTIGISCIQNLPYLEFTVGSLSSEQQEDFSVIIQTMFQDGFEQIRQGKKAGPYVTKMLRKGLGNLSQLHSTLGIRCGVGRNTNAVDVDGNIYPCHRYTNMKNYILGNTKTGLDEEKAKAYYRKLIESSRQSCSKCWIRQFCAGGCPWIRSVPDSTICYPLVSECKKRREGVEKALWMRKELRKANPKVYNAWSNFSNDKENKEDLLQWPDSSGMLTEIW